MIAELGPSLRPVRMGSMRAEATTRPDGTIYVRSLEALGPYPRSMTDRLAEWAQRTPDTIFVADRSEADGWRTFTYAQASSTIRHLAQAMLDASLSPEHPLLILSGNEIEHALLGYAAMLVGVPHAPISPAYSLVSKDYAKLKQIVGLLDPGMVYASDGDRFGPAIAAAIDPALPLVVRKNPPPGRNARLFGDLVSTAITGAVDAANAKVTPETIAKFLFTSGSTGMPKAVITTQRMLTCNQEMIRTALAFLADEPPVLVDWMPWNHVAGGSHNLGLALYNGGSFYIDDGLATPEGIKRTVKNLEDIAPTLYFNVPKGYELLVDHLVAKPALRDRFFSRLKLLQYAGASLSQHVWNQLDLAARTGTGERIMIITGYGSTETAPFAFTTTWAVDRAGLVGLPAAGLEVKLVPDGEKLELRLRGPNVTPGYWKQPGKTAESFDEEGYYKIGDALKFADPQDIARGFVFDGRVSEDFKLSTGTWVNMGSVRAGVISACAPLIRDVVLTGLDRNHIGALIFPDLEACRSLAGLAADADGHAIVGRLGGAGRLRGTAQCVGRPRHRQRHPCGARHPPRRAALDRCRRGHRQGLDQSARGNDCPRRAGRGPLCRAHPRPRYLLCAKGIPMTGNSNGPCAMFDDAWLVGGIRTPFVDYRGTLSAISPIDLGIKAARAAIEATGVDARDIGTTIAGNMAQASFDAYVTPRHIGLYAGVPVERPAHLVQRICGTGLEVLVQASDAVSLGRVDLVLGVGTELMSRNPIAAYTHRNGFPMGGVEFKDFLWEALMDPAAQCSMGDTAENLAKQYGITREDVDRYAARSFERAIDAAEAGFFDAEITPVVTESFDIDGLQSRGIKLGKGVERVAADSHPRPSPYEALAKLRPAFGGVQTGGNSSAIVDGAAAALVCSSGYATSKGLAPLARIIAGVSVGVPPHIMGIGPAPAIRALLDAAGMTLDQIDRLEINEAFGAQVLACARELGLDEDKLNVNGGAIAIGHPLGATGVRLALTLARELRRSKMRYGIASACVGGGQGIALLIENPGA